MSTTVTYKGSTLATVDNATKTLKTAGKYMEGDVIITDVSSSGSQGVVVTEETDAGGGIIKHITAVEISGTKEITANGTYDVTSFASANVNVPSGGSSNTFVVHLSKVNDVWTPDCTYSQLYEAYQVGKEIAWETDDPTITLGGMWDDASNCFNYAVWEQIADDHLIQKIYLFSSDGLNQDGDFEVYATYSANAHPSDVAQGMVFYNRNGKQIGTASGTTINNQNKTITPTESQQSITFDSGYTGLGTVTVNAISSTYVGSGIARKSSTDLTASGATVTVPAGYYSAQASKAVSSGSAKGPTSLSASSATVTTGTNTLTLTKTGVSTTPTVSAGYISSATSSTATVALTASVTTKAAATIMPTTTNQTIAAGTYLTGTQTIAGDADLVAGNIKSGVNIFGVTGTFEGGPDIPIFTLDNTLNVTCNKTFAECQALIQSSSDDHDEVDAAILYSPDEDPAVTGGLNVDWERTTLNQVIVYAISDNGKPSGQISYQSDGTLTFGPPQSVINLTVNRSGEFDAGLTSVYQIVTVPAGTTTAPSSISGTSATVSTGTNTLTLTKSVSVTPNVTTAGYVTSGTAGNSSVSLTASVTTKAAATITPTTTNQTIASGTYLTGTQTIAGDSNLVGSNILSGKSIFGVSGTVAFQTYYTGSSAPASSLGVNGDIYLQS